MNNKVNKNAGEVSAIVGYEFQYSIFATEIYNALLEDNNQIEWIEFASGHAGKIDDVLIGLKHSILAFQIKNIDSSAFSYSTLTSSSTQSILEGMFRGWQELMTSNPNKTIDVRILTTQPASTHDRIKSYLGEASSFQFFLNNFWFPIKEEKYNAENIPYVWSHTFQELLEITKSSPFEFIEFVKSVTFIFEYSTPKHFDHYVEKQRRIDIEEITKNIFRTIAKKGNIRYTKSDFLKEFGLIERYESYFTHSFFVDEEHYQPIEETFDQLQRVIKKYNKGYIALIGNAGSGKSTLLTKWIQKNNFRVLKYYSYVNTDMNYEFGFRGEAKIFLHDLLIQIRQATDSIQDRLPTENLEDLQKHFNNELIKLSHNEEKVIIIVDGLDHIEREQEVSKSLIGILPLPDMIPDNIYFILGSRTIENLEKLNSRIKTTIKEEKRVINIKPLSKDKILDFLLSYSINLSEYLLEELFVNTKGHPLFLRYTIEEIKNKKTNALKEIISQRIFSGDIYREYKVFWDNYKEQADFIEILGIIARFRDSFFDISLLKCFPKITRSNQYNVNKLSENYFYKIGNIWQFFHSSFKEFLINETAKDILTDSFENSVDKEFHLKISEAIERTESEYKWNKLYHLYKAEKFSAVTALSTQEYFRSQWFEFRGYKLIKDDIKFAIEASKRQGNVYCLFRCFLSSFELKQRFNNFNPRDNIDTFHQLGRISLASSFIYNNVELLVSQKSALDYSIALYAKGYKELAHDLFLRATPSYILNQSKNISTDRYDRDTFQPIDEFKLIASWAKAASLFNSVEEILSNV